MVGNAIRSLKERGGSSLQAIKKYIAANYKVDSEKLSPFIKKYLKTAVASGELVQTKGKGASGSFRLAAGKPERPAVTDTPSRGSKRASGPKEKKSVKSKPKTPKKAAVKKVPETKKKTVSSPAKGKKQPSKAKKVTKVPTKKPKAPRPRTAAKSKAPKKSSPKKK
jgi:histone H1/5